MQWKDFHKEPDYIIHMETMGDDLKVNYHSLKMMSKVNQAITAFITLNNFKNEFTL